MRETYYQIAGMVLKVCGPQRELSEGASALTPFEVPAAPHDWEYHIRFGGDLPEPPGAWEQVETGRLICREGDAVHTYLGVAHTTPEKAYLYICRKQGSSEAVVKRSAVPGRIGHKTIMRAMELEHMLSDHGALLLHASCVDYDGGAILFTAPSGAGKSTQAALWEDLRGAKVINGDRVVIRKTEGEYRAWGVPFCGTSGICHQASLPIRGIVYLQQAPTTNIQRLTGMKAFRKIWEGCTLQQWEPQDVDNSIACLTGLLEQVPVFLLACTPDETAVLALEKALFR